MTDDILTADQVAAMFGLDRKTVYAAAKRGELPSKRIGRKLLFSQRALVEWWCQQQGRVAPQRR